MTWACFTIHAAMAVKVWFGKLRVNQRFLKRNDIAVFAVFNPIVEKPHDFAGLPEIAHHLGDGLDVLDIIHVQVIALPEMRRLRQTPAPDEAPRRPWRCLYFGSRFFLSWIASRHARSDECE
jgi:hypothetical protein